jgi:hypothetical protein
MSYFGFDDYAALSSNRAQALDGDTGLQRTYNKLLDLHKNLHAQFRNHNIYLQAHRPTSNPVQFTSVSSPAETEAMTVQYFRSSGEAQLVERHMGRDFADTNTQVDARFHPVIELRLTPHYFAIELVISPEAWWDQENMAGKLSIARHRQAFYEMLRDLQGDFRFGFWHGIHLSDMHLTNGQLSSARALDAWMQTFCPGQDWFRIGIWYAPEDPALDGVNMCEEVFARVKMLHRLYTFLAWSSNNDYQKKAQRVAVS